MPDITIDIQIYCDGCGDGLCHLVSQHPAKSGVITIEPCPKCIESAKEEGRDDGYDQAVAERNEDA